jgi:hypothetical protein
MLVTPYTDKGKKSTRIGYGKQRRYGIEGGVGYFSDSGEGHHNNKSGTKPGFAPVLDHCALR